MIVPSGDTPNKQDEGVREVELKTTDMVLTAYLLSQNVEYKRIQREGTNRKKVIFVFEPDRELEELVEEFRKHRAYVNIREFMYQFELVRDVTFAELRET